MGRKENLKPPFTSEQNREEAAKNGRKGGIASGIVRREKKTVQKILSDFLDSPAKKNPNIAKLAAKVGLKDDESIKDLFTIVCLINTLKNGDLSDLERLTKLLGEQMEMTDTEAQKQAEFLAAIKDAVRDD